MNAYDAWSEAQFDQYIRELALFGANSIEILPPRTDDQPTSPHMKLPPLEMMVRLSKIIDSYGLDVWIWYPNSYPKMRTDYANDASIQAELADREEVFRRLKRIDHILVPAGDPGNLHPDVLFPFLDKMAAVLHRHHPQSEDLGFAAGVRADAGLARLVLSPRQREARLAGRRGVRPLVPHAAAGNAQSSSIRRSRSAIIPTSRTTWIASIRFANWDLAFALTLHRECYNPRPLAMKTIQNRACPIYLRLADLFRRHQRRREQVRLERSGLGPGDSGRGNAARLLPAVHQSRHSATMWRKASWLWRRTGRGRWRSTARWT